MLKICSSISLLLAVCMTALSLQAAEVAVPPTVESVYLGLSSGTLREAKLVTLPDNVLLRAGTTTITQDQVTAEITTAKPALRAQLTANQFFLLEQLSIQALLLLEARDWAIKMEIPKQEDDMTVIRAYLQSIAENATVSREEMTAFYTANSDMFGDLPFEAVENDLHNYLLDEKKQSIVDAHIRTLGTRVAIEVDAGWTSVQAVQALDNSVDKVRRSGKPAMVDFGASGCGPCDMMAPLLKALQQEYAERCTILYVDVREEQLLAARYGVQAIPEQVFFDKDGKEVFRHTGYYPREQILAKLAELGVE